MNHKNVPAIIKEVVSIAPQASLFGATLLGAVRENKIISWDKDVDLALDAIHATPDLIDKFKKAGFVVTGIYKLDLPEMIPFVGKENMGNYGKFILSKNGVKVEMCIFTKGWGQRYYYASGTPRFFVLPEHCLAELKKIKFYDFEVNIPVNAESQLAFVYGEDWRTPKQKWYFTAEHYLRREHTIIELRNDDGTKWSKWTGRKVIENKYGKQSFGGINVPVILK
jgi:hypothetical protein